MLPLALPEESVVVLRLGLLVGCEIAPPIRLRLFELVAGCLVVVEDDGLLVTCLPVRELELLELVDPFRLLVTPDRVETEFEGVRVVVLLLVPLREVI